ncbi:hypothetical protein [Pantoea sp. AS142]|uniref:hypothetical protein n=1 Tax=Pantoea sp. AS142 TaxID=3081292 RepID=UPI0030181DF4
MEFTNEEREVIAWFIGGHWQDFASGAEELISITALHRLAEKLGLENLPSAAARSE